jgi:photosystem II stability/assembly factor-like uncharacterized protein
MAQLALLVGMRAGLAIYHKTYTGTAAPTQVATVLTGHAIVRIIATDSQTLLVALADGTAQQSFDGGTTWSVAAGLAPAPIGLAAATVQGPMAIAFPRLSGATAYARMAGKPPALLGAGAGGMMLFRSEDDGIHWQVAGISGEQPGLVAAIVPDPLRPNLAYAGSDSGALLATVDRGKSWRVVARVAAPILCLAAVPLD